MTTEFYVEGIDDIKYLTLNFCIDNNGKTTNVKIIADKTTIQDSSIINQIVNYRKGIEYYPDTKLKNNCHDQTFSFISKEFEKSSIAESDFYKLENFKNGNYKYYDINYKNTLITRTENFQIEETNGEVYKYKIEWPKPNQYVLTYLEVGKKEHEYLIGEKIYVEIIKQIDYQTYVYRSNLLDQTIITGIIIKDN
ncbi:hypothetical protein [Flavobacterium sp.]|uniref:hypothetical protein n=1 Tax=Flavobacterium sp. TaxID=239 RepID=UPI004047A3CD